MLSQRDPSSHFPWRWFFSHSHLLAESHRHFIFLSSYLLTEGAVATFSPAIQLERLSQQRVEGLSCAIDGGRVGGHAEGRYVAHLLQRAVTFILYEQIEVVFFFLPIIWQLGLYLKAFCVSFCMCSNVYQESFGLVHRFPSQCDVTARMFYLVVTQRTIYLHMPNFSVSCDEMEKLNLIVLSDSGSLCDWELMKHLCWSPAVS